jgi:hypothetical protein
MHPPLRVLELRRNRLAAVIGRTLAAALSRQTYSLRCPRRNFVLSMCLLGEEQPRPFTDMQILSLYSATHAPRRACSMMAPSVVERRGV